MRVLTFGFAAALRLVPKRWRFRVAVVLARLLEPVIRRTSTYESRARIGSNSLREISLELVLRALTRRGTTFDPILRVEGLEHLPPPGSGPTLIVGPHTMLSLLFIRYLEDRGDEPTIIAVESLRVSGTRTPARILYPNPSLLLQCRRALADRRTLAAMIDRAEPERRNALLDTGAGSLHVSHALLRLALRLNVRILFFATRFTSEAGVVTHLSAPSPGSHTLPGILADFARFVGETQGIGPSPRSPRGEG